MHISDDGTFTFTKAEAKALLAFVSKDEHRITLSSLCLDTANGCAVATDGSTLVKCKGTVVGDHSGQAESLIPRELFDTALRLVRSKYHELHIRPSRPWRTLRHSTKAECWVTDNTLSSELDLNDRPRVAECSGALSDGKFPPYEQVIPDVNTEPRSGPVGFNMELLARLVLVQKATGAFTKCHFGAELDPSRFECNGNGSEWVTIIMPATRNG